MSIDFWRKKRKKRNRTMRPKQKKDILADQLSHPGQVLPTEWSLLPQIFSVICKVYGHLHMNLFVTKANTKLLLYVSSSGSYSMELRCFSTFMERSQCIHISPFTLLTNLSLILAAPLWPQKEWFPNLLAPLVEEHIEHPLLWNLYVKLHLRKFHRGQETLRLHPWKL